ncbi:hypothetical protein KO529_22000 [Arenibacter algicola]|uniref:hypothetical protein n=1 Tax=Arenibacter algicola TaxID=616991 RepID=UPI001C06B2B6|nr:hypothetical protein [Arenibacter algicola]MBU2907490.1 hypothetical protein [Arenibacter algicola]
MGIVLLPFVLGAIIIGLIAIFKSFRLIDTKHIEIKEILYGFLTSIILYGLIGLFYLIEGKAWALSPYFRLPIIMIFIPYIIHKGTEKNKNPKVIALSKILLVSIGITTLIGAIFHGYFFDIMEHFGTEKNY